MQKDPEPGIVVDPATIVNAYVYVINDPLNLQDPSGRSWWSKSGRKIFYGTLIGILSGGVGLAFGAATGAALGSSLISSLLGSFVGGLLGGYAGGALAEITGIMSFEDGFKLFGAIGSLGGALGAFNPDFLGSGHFCVPRTLKIWGSIATSVGVTVPLLKWWAGETLEIQFNYTKQI